MKIANESYIELNYSSNCKESNHRTSSGYFPLLNFNSNLYNSCQSKFSKFVGNKKQDIKLIINNKMKEQITLNDYISKNSNNKNELTPIPFINKRKIKNNQEKKDLKEFQRNVVLMRRLEYENKMKEKKMKQKYNNKISKIIYIQKIIKGYLVRKVIKQVNIIKETLLNFFFSINYCIRKKYYNILKKNILEMKEKNISNNIINGNNESTIKNDFNNLDFDNNIINKENENKKSNEVLDDKKNKKNINEEINIKLLLEEREQIKSNNNETTNNKSKNKKKKISYKNKYNPSPFVANEKHDSIIENDDYIDFSNKESTSKKKNKKNNNSNNNNINNIPNRNPKNKKIKFYLSDISSNKELNKSKTEIIQRQFRKYLSKKGYYGKFDIRKIAVIYLLKNMIIYNIRPFVINILKINYKQLKRIITTQEESYNNISTERIKNVIKVYRLAKNEIK